MLMTNDYKHDDSVDLDEVIMKFDEYDENKLLFLGHL